MENTLTVPRLEALHTEWEKHPPLPIMVQAYLGVGKPDEEVGDPAELVNILQNMPGTRVEVTRRNHGG